MELECETNDWKSAFVANAVSGGLGGAALIAIQQPLDTVKVKMQTFPRAYRTIVGTILKTLKEERFRGFYSGSTPAFLSNTFENAVLFMANGYTLGAVRWLADTGHDQVTVLQRACAASLAAFISSIAITPPDIVKVRLQAQRALMERIEAPLPGRRLSTPTVVKMVMKEDGFSGFFRGLSSTMMRDIPGYFIFFGGYYFFRKQLAPSNIMNYDDDVCAWRIALSGGLAGGIVWALIFPADVVKTRIQVKIDPPNILQVVQMLVKQGGFLSLYRGFGSIVSAAVFSNAALFTVAEYSKRFLFSQKLLSN